MIGEAFAGALRKRFGEAAAVYDYGHPETFSHLWSEQSEGKPWVLGNIDRRKHIVIVWDGREDASDPATRLAADLTPLDWVLAFSLHALRRREQAVEGIRVHLIDLTGTRFANAWAVRMRHQLLEEMPWLSLYAPLIPSPGGEPVRYRRGYRPIIAGDAEEVDLLTRNPADGNELTKRAEQPVHSLLTRNPKDGNELVLTGAGKTLPVANAGAQFALEGLARQWTASLVQGADHHNVNNVVGPAVLSRFFGWPPPVKSALLDAFVQKLDWTSMLPGAKDPLKPPSSFKEQLADSGIGKMNVLVVDDELARGWDAMLCGFFEKSRGKLSPKKDEFVRLDEDGPDTDPIQIFGTESAESLLAALDRDFRAFFRQRNLEFFFVSQDFRAELLVLDLRLHGHAGSAASRTYLRDLVRRIRQWELNKPENLAWPAIGDGEIKAVEAWLERSGPIDPLTEASAITLLPRVLALAAPLTPIILFSSTGRADIKEKLKPYRNIQTGFAKPRVLQDLEAIRESVAHFSDGVREGIRMLKLRSQLAKCLRIAAEVDLDRKRNKFDEPKKKGAHIEFFFDESKDDGTPQFVSASAAAVFADEGDADNLQKALKSQAEYASGDLPVWNKARLCPGKPLEKFKNIRTKTEFIDSVEVLGSAIAAHKALRDRWASLRVMRYADEETSDDHAPKVLGGRQYRWKDDHLDLMLRFSVQFNFCVLPRYLGLDDVTCNLYFDRRSMPPWSRWMEYDKPTKWNKTTYDKERKKAEELCARLGFEYTEALLSQRELGKNAGAPNTAPLMTTYPASAYYPFVREALMSWGPDWTARIQYHELRGQQLSERSKEGYDLRFPDDQLKFDRRRWLHDVADWVAGPSKNRAWADALKPIFPHQLTTELSVGLEACLQATRSASRERADECINTLLTSPNIYIVPEWKQRNMREISMV